VAERIAAASPVEPKIPLAFIYDFVVKTEGLGPSFDHSQNIKDGTAFSTAGSS